MCRCESNLQVMLAAIDCEILSQLDSSGCLNPDINHVIGHTHMSHPHVPHTHTHTHTHTQATLPASDLGKNDKSCWKRYETISEREMTGIQSNNPSSQPPLHCLQLYTAFSSSQLCLSLDQEEVQLWGSRSKFSPLDSSTTKLHPHLFDVYRT